MYSYRAAVDFVDDMEECMREPTQHIGVFHNQTLTGIRLILNTWRNKNEVVALKGE